MNNSDERVALQAIEFWSTVCDVEMDIKEEIIEVSLWEYVKGMLIFLLFKGTRCR